MPQDDDGRRNAKAPGLIPEGSLSRAVRVGAALAGAAGRAAGRRVWGSSPGADPAEHLSQTFGKLKGVSMKLGQLLSYLDFHTPADWKPALSRLQHDSTAMPPELVRQIVSEDLGGAPDALFADWEDEPIAAASIGQVHRARLRDGTPVAVKVRYPAIDRIVRQDLENLALVRRLGGSLFPGLDGEALLAELRERFLEECDYRREADNQRAFREFFRGNDAIVIPEPHLDQCSERVLTMALVDGLRFDEFVEGAGERDRNHAARTIHDFAFQSIFRLGILNCDPHPGNYLFLAGGVAFLDFGCVRRFSADTIWLWRSMLRSALERDCERFAQAVVGIGLAETGNGFDFDALYAQYLYLIRPWLTAEAHLTPEFVTQIYRGSLLSNPKRRQLRMPPELLFANRLQWGLYSVLGRLGSRFSMREAILDILYEPEEPRPEPFSDSELRYYTSRLR